jgi:hypothetical protein
MNIPDILLASIVPLDHSTITKYRNELGLKTHRINTTVNHIEMLFEILKEFPQHIEHISTNRLRSTEAFWKRRPELLVAFNNCWKAAKKDLAIQDGDWEASIEREVPMTFVDTTPRIEIASPEQRVKEALKEAVDIAVANDMYSVAHDIIEILEDF